MRDRAVIATLTCTAMRHESLITVKVGHVDLKREGIFQDPSTMHTKGSKWINTRIIPIDDAIQKIVIDWIKYLKEKLNFSDNDPLFPKEQLLHNAYNQFVGGVALSKEHIESQHVIPEIIKRVFARVGLKYHNPHSFRDMLTHYVISNYGIQELAALSLNLGHEHIATTVGNYYSPTPEQQFEILSKIGKPKELGGIPKEMLEYVRMQMAKNSSKDD